MKTIFETETLSDVQLVERSRDGNQKAFAQIVERYQSLICALTYSASGNLQTSEDLAQVTFITAWCQLRSLKEPAKLKSWLCGIARNVTNNSFRKDQRTPTAHAEVLDAAVAVSDAVTPRDRAISKEEEAILWRSLSELPESYREPLVLFYRQHQSTTEVATALDVTEEVVRQRLARGRAMLAEKISKFVETTLSSTGPTTAFTIGVLAALPVLTTSAKAAVVGATAAKGSATAKAGGAAGFSGLLSSILGVAPIAVLGGWIGRLMSRDESGSPQARESVIRFWRVVVGCLVAFVALPLLLVVFLASIPAPVSKENLFGGLTMWLGMMYIVLVAALAMWVWQRRRKIHPQATGVDEKAATNKRPFTMWVVLAMIGTGILLGAIVLPRMNRNLRRLSTAEAQAFAGEHPDAKFSVLQYQNGNRDLWIERHENGRLYLFVAPADDAMLSLLAEKGIACPTYVQGRDFEIFGWPGRLLVLLCVFILAIGAVILLKRPRNKASVS
jgi:RNA polymerase sigma factor (sigma-70 family)